MTGCGHRSETKPDASPALWGIHPKPGAGSNATLARHGSRDTPYGGGSSTYTTYQPGYRVTSLPSGYRTETISGNTYHYHNGNYYRRSSGGYVVIDAPRDSRYYGEYGRIRQATPPERGYYPEAYDSHDRRYERADIITRLPDGYRVVNHRGRQYYQVGERYYIREDGAYAAVSKPY